MARAAGWGVAQHPLMPSAPAAAAGKGAVGAGAASVPGDARGISAIELCIAPGEGRGAVRKH